MRRRLFNVGSAISLVLCVIVAGLWVRSYFACDAVGRFAKPTADGHQMLRVAASCRGELIYVRFNWRTTSGAPGFAYRRSPPVDDVTTEETRRRGVGALGFAVLIASAQDLPSIGVIIPNWLCMLVLIVLPGRWLLEYRRARRTRDPNRCATCGYDLRATPDRCPECGTPARAVGKA